MDEEQKKIDRIFAALRRFSQPRPELLRQILNQTEEPVRSPYFWGNFIQRRSFLTFSAMAVVVFLLVVFGNEFSPSHDPFANSKTAHAQIIKEMDRVIESGFAGELEILAAEDALAAEVEADDYVDNLNNLENDLLP